MEELWNVQEVSEYLKDSGPGASRKTLSRWGVRATQYVMGPSGRPEARYDATEVRAAHAARPGRGRPTRRT